MVKEFKSKFFKSLKSGRLNMFLIFLGLSFVFLLLTKFTKEYTKTIEFEIAPINAQPNHVILNDTTHNFDITLRTYGFKFLRYYLSKPNITVNLNDLDIVGNKYIWTKSKGIAHVNSQFTENVNLLAVNPDSIVFRFDTNAVKTVPIEFQSNITFKPGYDVSGKYKIIPDSIKIVGPKILIDTINVIKTEILEIKNSNSNFENQLNIILPDSTKNITYSQKHVVIKGIVEKFTEGTIEVPVDIINIPEGSKINYFPKTVRVKYYVSLSNFKQINKNDFIVECDFGKTKPNTMYLEPELVKFPENVKNVKLVQKRIDFIISK